jgi:hypothetical protein
MQRLRHSDIRTTLNNYVTQNPLLEFAQHRAIVARMDNRHIGTTPLISAASSSTSESTQVQDMLENFALSQLRSHGVTLEALRKYATKENVGSKKNGQWSYSSTAIDDLAKNYIAKEDAVQMLCISRSGFHHWIKSKGVQTAVVGKVSLVRTDEVMARIRRLRARQVA